MNLSYSGECIGGSGSDPCQCDLKYVIKVAVALGVAETGATACTGLFAPPAIAICLAGVTVVYLGSLALLTTEKNECVSNCK